MTVIFDREQHRHRMSAEIEVIQVTPQRRSPRLIRDEALLKRLEGSFSAAVDLSDRLSRLTQSLQAQGVRYCVFGGWVRDTIFGLREISKARPPRDIDLVARGIDVDELLHQLPSDVRPTIFGGIQSDAGPVAFDVWPLHETFLINYLGLPPTFESLLESTDFTINAALFFPGQGTDGPKILDGGMAEALATRTLAFNNATLPFPVMQCARLAVYAGKLSLGLDPAVHAFMQDVIADPARRELVLLGLDENYPADIAACGRQLLLELGAAQG